MPSPRVIVTRPAREAAQWAALLGERAQEVLQGPRAALGPPWTKDHRVALAATVVAGDGLTSPAREDGTHA